MVYNIKFIEYLWIINRQLTAISAASALLVLPNANYLARVRKVHILLLSLLQCFNWLPKNSGLNHIVELVEIMELGAKPQRVENFPPLPSVAWSLSVAFSSLMTWLLLLSWLASSPSVGRETGMGGHVWHSMTKYYVNVPINAIIWYVTRSSKCRPCSNFDVYTVYIPVACLLAGLISSWCRHFVHSYKASVTCSLQ